MTRRLIRLYLESRPVAVAALGIAGFGALVGVLCRVSASFEGSGFTVPGILPIVPAVLIALASRSPFGETEDSAGSRLPWLSIATIAGLFAESCLASALSLSASAAENAVQLSIRNLAGFLGLALLSNRALGSDRGWIVSGCYVAAICMIRISGNQIGPLMTWPGEPVDDLGAAAISFGGLAAGLLAHLLGRPVRMPSFATGGRSRRSVLG